MKYFSKRTLAYIIDCLVCFGVLMLVIQLIILSPVRPLMGITNEWLANSLNLQLYVLTTISIPTWVYFAYFDSNKSKGTIGKRLMKLSVRDDQDKKISFSKSFLRTILKLSPWEIIHAGVIFPKPVYFEEGFTGTPILLIIGILLFMTYAISILLDTNKQVLYDKLMKTKVSSINM